MIPEVTQEDILKRLSGRRMVPASWVWDTLCDIMERELAAEYHGMELTRRLLEEKINMKNSFCNWLPGLIPTDLAGVNGSEITVIPFTSFLQAIGMIMDVDYRTRAESAVRGVIAHLRHGGLDPASVWIFSDLIVLENECSSGTCIPELRTETDWIGDHPWAPVFDVPNPGARGLD